MVACPVCRSKAAFAFETKFVEVNQCQNEACKHLFAKTVKPNMGAYDPELDRQKDYTIYEQRNKLLVGYFRKTGFIKPGYHILDFGAGTGHLLGTMKKAIPDLRISAIEFNEASHSDLREMGVETYKTIDQIPLEHQFEAIIFMEVIEHLDDPLEVLEELKKRLKPGGRLFLTTPAGDLRQQVTKKWELYAYHSYNHVQFFTERSLENCLKRAGFKHFTYTYINELYPDKKGSAIQTKIDALKGKYRYWRGYTDHLTFFAS